MSATEPLPLDPPADLRRELGEEALAFLDRFVATRRDAPASFDPPAAGLLERLGDPPPEQGVELRDLLDRVERSSRTGIDTAAGSHLSYIPNGGLYAGALGELLAAGINRYTGGAHGSPGAIAIEQGVVDWMVGLFDLGPAAAGLLLSGGSLANFTAVVAARTRLGDDFRHGTVYTSTRAHHSVTKATRLAGIAADRVRHVAVDDDLRLDVAALEARIDDDLADGLRPMAIVGSAGTTDTGTIDPLDELATVAARHDAWCHVDAAYGGFFRLTRRGTRRLRGIERADSITVDAHKSLFMPYGFGGLLVRDGTALAAAHASRGQYMQDVYDMAGAPHYFAIGPELTRPFRGLPVWLALHLHGVDTFRRELDRMLDLAERAHRELVAHPSVEVAVTPDLSILAVRSRHGDDDSRRLFAHCNASRRVHLSSTTVAGRFTIRLAFLNPRTTDRHVDAILELLQTAPPPPTP